MQLQHQQQAGHQSAAQQLQQQQNLLQMAQLSGQRPNVLPNQLQMSNAAGMQMLDDPLFRQIVGQQPPTNLQTQTQDRQRVAEQHRQFRQQLMAVANTAQDQQPNAQQQASLNAQLAALNGGQNLNHFASLQAAQLKQAQQQQQALMGQQPQKKPSNAFELMNGRPPQ